MKTYIILMNNGVDLVGSDQLIPVDGRLRHIGWYDAAKDKKISLSAIGKEVTSYRVMKGVTLNTFTEVYRGPLY